MTGVAGGLSAQVHEDPTKVGVSHIVPYAAWCIEIVSGDDAVDECPHPAVPRCERVVGVVSLHDVADEVYIDIDPSEAIQHPDRFRESGVT